MTANRVLVDMQSEIYFPTSFCPELRTGKLGPVYEMRTYTIGYGDLPELLKIWEAALEERVKFSPPLLAMVSEHGPLNRFVHIWPYESLQHRTEVRNEAAASGHWPPRGGMAFAVKQDHASHAVFTVAVTGEVRGDQLDCRGLRTAVCQTVLWPAVRTF